MQNITRKIIDTCHRSLMLVAIFIMSQLFISCKKFVEVGLPKSQLSAEAVFSNESTAEAALSRLYIVGFGYGGGGLNSVTMLGNYLADESTVYNTSVDIQQLGNNQLSATNSYCSSLWSACYQTIFNANALIEGVEGNPKISLPKQNQLIGEALFFRALSHLTLTSFFGRVPIIRSTDYRENTIMPQSSEQDVLMLVVDDLLLSAELLPPNYSVTANERARVNRFAAWALLARAYLYNQNWEKAEEFSTKLISQTDQFSLTPLAEVFLKNSKESIFQFKPVSTTFNTNEGNLLILTGRPTIIALNNNFVASFDNTDLRKTSWIGRYTLGTESWPYFYKYKVKTSTVLSEYSSVLRLAEQYLIRAEARARTGQLNTAIEDIDRVRHRAGLSKLADMSSPLSATDILDYILQERKAELFGEWAHRWLDLKRFGKASVVLTAVKPGWKETALLFPIPQAELNLNFRLEQNLGY